MRKIMMIALAVLTFSSAWAQENVTDSLYVDGDDEILRIVQNDSIETVSTNTRGSESAFDWNLDLVEDKSRSVISLGVKPSIELGMQFIGGGDGGQFKGFGCAEMRYNFARLAFYPGNSKWWYTLDFGLSYRQWMLKKNNMLVGDDDSNLAFAPFPADVQRGSAMLCTFGADTKFLVHRQLGHYGSMAFGAMYSGHYNSSHVVNSYIDSQDKLRFQMYKGLSRNNLSFRLEYNVDKKAKFYFDYAPWSVFKKGVGPQTSVFTVGVGLNF